MMYLVVYMNWALVVTYAVYHYGQHGNADIVQPYLKIFPQPACSRP